MGAGVVVEGEVVVAEGVISLPFLSSANNGLFVLGANVDVVVE